MSRQELLELHTKCLQFNKKFQDVALIFEHIIWVGDKVSINLQTKYNTILLVETDNFNVAHTVIATAWNIENYFGIIKEKNND